MDFPFGRKSKIALLVSILSPQAFISAAEAEDYFNPKLLELTETQSPDVDLTALSKKGSQKEGTYLVSIFVNNSLKKTENVKFIKSQDGNDKLRPCFSKGQLVSYGIKLDSVNFDNAGETDSNCLDISKILTGTSTDFIFNQQRLDIKIPNIYEENTARGSVPPELWENGIAAIFSNYSFSGATTKNKDSNNSNQKNNSYINLRNGANLGAWRLRNYSTWSSEADSGNKWASASTFVQRDIKTLSALMTLGDSSSPSEVFDSVPFRGAQLASNDDMLPDSMQGYSPVVRGIARSNATVEVRQNGYVIYQGAVAAGAFEVKDLYATSSSGDLLVRVKESDGSEQNFIVPYSSVPILQREGRVKFSVTAGEYRPYDSSSEKQNFVQGTAIWGLPKEFTLYGGLQLVEKYKALSAGVGKNLKNIGALSFDVTAAASDLGPRATSTEDQAKGLSYRLRYGKSFVETGTNFTLAAYRYSTSGYYSMQDVMDSYGDDENDRLNVKKSRAEITLSQKLWGNAGMLSLSYIDEKYWQGAKSTSTTSFGYSNAWNAISYNINYSQNKNDDENDKRIYLNVSLPLDKWLSNSRVNYSINSSKNNDTTQTMGLSGTALENRNLDWNMQQSYTNHGEGAGGDLSGTYKSTYGIINTGYSYDNNATRINYGAEGAIMLHQYGVTLSQPLNNTVALVRAPGANGVKIENQTGVHTDWRGYTVVPNVMPYRTNIITLDSETLGVNSEISQTSQTVIPTEGAVVLANYNVASGARMLMTILQMNGTPIPLAASVIKPDGSISMVSDGGQVYITGADDEGKLTVEWKNGKQHQCSVNYKLTSEMRNESGLYSLQTRCE